MRSANNMFLSPEYADAAVIAREAGLELLARLEWMTVRPRVVVNAMTGLAEINDKLQQRYPDATMLTLDAPLEPHSVDLLFANFYLPWQADWQAVLQQWLRLLAPEGVLMISALGIDTLRGWDEVLQAENLPVRLDMHELGDALMHGGFSDPVLDVDYFDVNYREPDKLLQDLQHSGMWLPQTAHSLSADSLPPKENGIWTLTYEVVFAHAFGPPIKNTFTAESDGVVRIPLSSLKKNKGE